jgi:transcriptional regulator with XRE-family HTH domain
VPNEIDPITRFMADELVAQYKGRRLTQADLVERTSINATTMQRIMAGKSNVTLPQLFAIAKALGTSAELLVQGAERRRDEQV